MIFMSLQGKAVSEARVVLPREEVTTPVKKEIIIWCATNMASNQLSSPVLRETQKNAFMNIIHASEIQFVLPPYSLLSQNNL